MTRKIVFRKLNHTGHSTLHLEAGEAFSLALQEIKSGNYLYLEPEKKIVTSERELNLNNVDEVLVLPPVVGG